MRLRLSRGDTIIEVMLAFTIFSMLAVGALTVMNQGTASAQDSLETTLVRQQIDNQAETLRFLHQAYLADASNVTVGSLPDKFRATVTLAQNAALTQPSAFGADCTQTLPVAANNRFVLDTDGSMVANVNPANIDTAPPYAQLMDTGSTSYGLWIEPVISDASVASGTARYIDYHIRACWNSAGSSPQRTLGTIVRLYVPENVDTGTSGGGGTIIPTPPPDEFTLAGGSANPCYPHKDLERNDNEGTPPWGVFSFFPSDPVNTDGSRGVNMSGGAGSPYDCARPAGAGGPVYSCANYDARYAPNIPAASNGIYRIIINYGDFNCGANTILSNYVFKIDVYVNNVSRASADLDIGQSVGAIDIGQLNAGDTVEIRWWNNHFFGGFEDPDLMINSLIFQRTA